MLIQIKLKSVLTSQGILPQFMEETLMGCYDVGGWVVEIAILKDRTAITRT